MLTLGIRSRSLRTKELFVCYQQPSASRVREMTSKISSVHHVRNDSRILSARSMWHRLLRAQLIAERSAAKGLIVKKNRLTRKPFKDEQERDASLGALTHTLLPSQKFQSTTRRMFSSLSHVDKDGKASMVDVGSKVESKRVAIAKGVVQVDSTISKLITENNGKKGDVLSVAQLAGIIGAKRTPDLIPLCHPISLSYANVSLRLNEKLNRVEITAEVRCTGKTGVEMEALTAVSIAALTVYDMCKFAAPPTALKITDIELISKTGGTKGDFYRA